MSFMWDAHAPSECRIEIKLTINLQPWGFVGSDCSPSEHNTTINICGIEAVFRAFRALPMNTAFCIPSKIDSTINLRSFESIREAQLDWCELRHFAFDIQSTESLKDLFDLLPKCKILFDLLLTADACNSFAAFAELFVGVMGSNANVANPKAWHETFFVEDAGTFTARD